MENILNAQKKIGLSLILFIAVFSFISLKLLSPPAVVKATEDPNVFSAERALNYLKVIAAKPHSAGTEEHGKVYEYIINYFNEKGLEVSMQTGPAIRPFRGALVGGNAKNIIARMKGIDSSKAILVMSHYDSQPNTPGAADDGAGVAAMMETIDILQKGAPLKNDVIFLVTDLEEVGLLGAEYFVSQYDQLEEIGMILNFEARGNKGVSFTFETSKDNGWIIREFKKAVPSPMANSLAYEIYKLMPNDSDFTMFKNTGISGLNSAFIEGYSNYHSMTDTPENINLGSVQNHGDLMLGMIKHFGNLDITNTKDEDAIYFNPISSFLVIFPISLDIPFMVITIILFLVVVFIGYKKERINLKHFFLGTALFLGSTMIAMALVWGLKFCVLFLYPHYTNFYHANFYNSTYYVLTIVGMVIFAFSVLFEWGIIRFTFESLFAGAMFFLIIAMVIIKMYLNTGAYILYYPISIALIVFLFLFLKDISIENKPGIYGLGQVLILIAPMGLWIPFAYTLFVVFSFSLPFAAVGFFALFFPFLVPAQMLIHKYNSYVTLIISFILIVTGFFIGHLTSSYNEERPLQTELMYAVDMDTEQALWVSSHQKLDIWNSQFINSHTYEKFVEFYPESNWKVWKAKAELLKSKMGDIEVLNDEENGDMREINIKITPSKATNSLELWFPKGTEITNLNNREITKNHSKEGAKTRFVFYAPPKGGLNITFKFPKDEALEIRYIERRMGLPESLLFHDLPEYMIHGPGRMSNSSQYKKTIKL